MARNERRGGLDKPTRDTLSEIDKALAELAIAETPQPDEFTMKDLMTRARSEGKDVGRTTLQKLVYEKIESGQWTSRKIYNIIYYKRVDK